MSSLIINKINEFRNRYSNQPYVDKLSDLLINTVDEKNYYSQYITEISEVLYNIYMLDIRYYFIDSILATILADRYNGYNFALKPVYPNELLNKLKKYVDIVLLYSFNMADYNEKQAIELINNIHDNISRGGKYIVITAILALEYIRYNWFYNEELKIDVMYLLAKIYFTSLIG